MSKNLRVFRILFVAFLLAVFLTPVFVTNSFSKTSTVDPFRSANQSQASIPLGHSGIHLAHYRVASEFSGEAKLQTNSTPNYDEQIGLSYVGNMNSMSYNVTATTNVDADGYGPSYLVNGLTNQGYWYQVGLAYDWPTINGGNLPGFNMAYEVFNNSGASIFPSNGGGLAPFSGTVNPNDIVNLALVLSSGRICLEASDYETGASASQCLTAVGSYFIGDSSSPSNNNGFFTGLMTEWYHSSAYFGGENPTLYSTGNSVSSAWMFMSEANVATSNILFTKTVLQGYSGSTLYSLASDGASEVSNGTILITGSSLTSTSVSLTIRYTTNDGSTPLALPSITYPASGTVKNMTLSTYPATIELSLGTRWQVAMPCSCNITDSWQLNSSNSGWALGTTVENILVYHEYNTSFTFTTIGDSLPQGHFYSVEYYHLGTLTSNSYPAKSFWVDAGTNYSLIGVSPEPYDSWRPNKMGGTINSSVRQDIQFYHQYLVSFSYKVLGGGIGYSTPIVTFQEFGKANSTLANSEPVWIDQTGNISFESNLTSSLNIGERWQALGSTNVSGVVFSSTRTYSVSYQNQFSLNVIYPSEMNGTAQKWLNASSTIEINEPQQAGWLSVGWAGEGSGSYTGNKTTTILNINGPINESAIYYPGLTIKATAGTIDFSFDSARGSISPGTSKTIYIPIGTTVTLSSSSPFFYSFSGWSGASSSKSPQIVLTVNSPETIKSNYTSPLLVPGVVALFVVIVCIGGFLFLRRNRSASTFS
ncbi:MAG: hypothetical protein ACYCQJ_06660 [Nitrososphaerales archaeon]